MRGTVLYGPRDVRFEERDFPKILEPTDAIIRISAACVCGSDLWPYRGIQRIEQPTPMGHEYCGIVEEVGKDVRMIKRGQFVVGSFATSDNTCAICKHGYQSSCHQREFMSAAQAPFLRVPLADGTLVPTSGIPSEDLIPSLLALSDVMGTGWFAADAANVKPGSTVAVVGDGAVGLLGVLSAKQMGAERIIAMSRHATRQKLAREFGATDIVTERGGEGIARIKELTKGIGADSVLECVGTQQSMMQAINSTRPGDPEIARARVTRVVSAFDVGKVVNPKTARSQGYSGIIMGIGMALMEHTVYDERDGSIVTSNLADYAVPVNADIPGIEVLFVDKPDPYIDDQGIGARGLGEIPITGVAAAVANAIYHATGTRVRELPITPDKLLRT